MSRNARTGGIQAQAGAGQNVNANHQLNRKQERLNLPIVTSQVEVPTPLRALCQQGTHLMTSRRTFPGPTGGNWSASPMKSSWAEGGHAERRAEARGRSSMEASSTMMASAWGEGERGGGGGRGIG